MKLTKDVLKKLIKESLQEIGEETFKQDGTKMHPIVLRRVHPANLKETIASRSLNVDIPEVFFVVEMLDRSVKYVKFSKNNKSISVFPDSTFTN